jgi:hypothetical protein
MDDRPADMNKPICEGAMTPERRQELHEKANRILESDQADLLVALMDLLYRHVAIDQKR